MKHKNLPRLLLLLAAISASVSCRSEIPVYHPAATAQQPATPQTAAPQPTLATLEGAWLQFRHKQPFDEGKESWFYVKDGVCYQYDAEHKGTPPQAPARMLIDPTCEHCKRVDDEQGRSWLKTHAAYKVQEGVGQLSITAGEGQYLYIYGSGKTGDEPARLEIKRKLREGVYEGLFHGDFYYQMNGGRLDQPYVLTVSGPLSVIIYTAQP